MFLITYKRWNHHVNDVKTAADIVYGCTGDEKDYERMQNILGNMKFDEVFHGNGFVVQCYNERSIDNV